MCLDGEVQVILTGYGYGYGGSSDGGSSEVAIDISKATRLLVVGVLID